MSEKPLLELSNAYFDDEETLIEDATGDDDYIPFTYSISSYGADYDVEGLVRRYKNKDLYIPDFQREYVWSTVRASQFIESLLLGLPVPGIFLAKEDDTQRLLVVDGSQRIRSLAHFYENELVLTGVQKRFEGLTYSKLDPADRRRLDNSILHATVIRQDDPSEDHSGIYFVFERLNKGAMLLRPQEIRSAIYPGKFNDLLVELNQRSSWRALYGQADKRRRDQELILRFMALYFESDNYRRPMEDFLNRFMARNRNLRFYSAALITDVFESTIQVLHECLGEKAFRAKRSVNAALFDSLAVGIARRLQQGSIEDCDELKRRYEELLNNEDYQISISVSTADEANVSKRLSLATRAFVDVS